MLRLNHSNAALLAVVVCAISLVACSSDPLTSSLRPTADDQAAAPGVAPAGAVGAMIRVGEATRQAGDPANAVLFFRRAHALVPFKAEPLVRLGVALNDLGQFNEAAEAFRDALNIEHNNTEALRGLGFALIGLNQPELAIDQFKAAIAIEPDYRSFNGLGVASDHLGQHKAAQDYYESGLKIFPNNLTLLNNLGLSQILSRDYDAAIGTLVGAVQQPGASARQRQNLALAYGMAGKDTDAARVSRIDLGPRDVQDNLAYYPILRGADDKVLLAAILGVHAPDRLVSQPLPGQPASPTGPASDAGKNMEAPAPTAKPTASVETLPVPVAGAQPSPTEVAQAAATKPAAGTSHIQSVVAISIPTSHPSAAARAAVEAANRPTTHIPPAAVSSEAAPPAPAANQATSPGGQGETDLGHERIQQPTAQPQESSSAVNALREDTHTVEEAAATGARDLAGLPTSGPTVMADQSQFRADAPIKTALRPSAAGNDGAPVWYASPIATPVNAAVHQNTFLDKIFEYLFEPNAPAASKIAAVPPTNGKAASAAPASQVATAPAAGDNVAAIQPAAGIAHSQSSWLGDIGEFFRARQSATPAAEHQPIGGGAAASP